MSGGPARQASRSDRLRLLRVRIGEESYGVEVGRVGAVIDDPPAITPVPRTADAVNGVARLRGEVTVAVDAHKLLGVDRSADEASRRTIVFPRGADETPVAIEIDEVFETDVYHVGRIKPVETRGFDPGIFAAVVETSEGEIGVLGPNRLTATAVGEDRRV